MTQNNEQRMRQTKRLHFTVVSRDEEAVKAMARRQLGAGEWDIEVKFVGYTDAYVTATSK